MKAKIIVFFILAILLIISYKNKETITQVPKIKNIQSENTKKEKQTISLKLNNEIVNISLDDYVVGVVACEMPASFEKEALKAMAVAARTYAKYKLDNNKNYVFSSTISDQCYITKDQMKDKWKNSYDKYYTKIKNATIDTMDEYITYKEKPILAMYFAVSNGKTEDCEKVFSQKKDYLVSVDSSWDKKISYKEEVLKINLSDFLNKLNINDKKINNINIERTPSSRVSYVSINSKKIKGTDFRKLFNLKSTDFTITSNGDNIIIYTKGYGHGVGMSQYGANYMALEGYDYSNILKHYYKDTKIMNK